MRTLPVSISYGEPGGPIFRGLARTGTGFLQGSPDGVDVAVAGAARIAIDDRQREEAAPPPIEFSSDPLGRVPKCQDRQRSRGALLDTTEAWPGVVAAGLTCFAWSGPRRRTSPRPRSSAPTLAASPGSSCRSPTNRPRRLNGRPPRRKAPHARDGRRPDGRVREHSVSGHRST
jgi:hypothetical protein